MLLNADGMAQFAMHLPDNERPAGRSEKDEQKGRRQCNPRSQRHPFCAAVCNACHQSPVMCISSFAHALCAPTNMTQGDIFRYVFLNIYRQLLNMDRLVMQGCRKNDSFSQFRCQKMTALNQGKAILLPPIG